MKSGLGEVLAGYTIVVGWLACCLLLWSCLPPPPAPPAPPEATCETVCARWRALDCLEGRDTPDGEACEVVCALWERHWDLPCMGAVESCDAIEVCP